MSAPSPGGPSRARRRPLRVGIGGLAIESSTFSAHRAGERDFVVLRGDELAERYPFLDDWRWPGWPELEFVPLFHARALPGGPVLPEVYDRLEAELLERLRAAVDLAPLDGFVLDIHGAMSVAGRDDAEGGLLRRIRALLGTDCLVSASLDLHGQVSPALAENADLLTAYRTAPHLDQVATRERACRTLITCLSQHIRPTRAWVWVPVLLPGEKTSTRVEPARSIYAQLEQVEQRPGILDAALLVGYAWADEPRSGATVWVSGTDEEAVATEAERLARAWWRARDEFEFCAPAGSVQWCVTQAFATSARPFFISDSGDNPTAGGAGDGAAMLGELLDTPELARAERTAIWASCVAPDAGALILARKLAAY